MKQLLFSLLMLQSAFSFSQLEVEHIRIGLDSISDSGLFPHISNYYEGVIPLKELANEEGIQVSGGYSIISFEVSYSINGKSISKQVIGNQFPADLIQEIQKNALGDYLFITQIMAKNKSNSLVGIVPMSLIPIE